MKIALTQMDIWWQEKEKNRELCERLTRKAAEAGAQIIVFPEMTLTGFTMETGQFGERENSGTRRFFRQLSQCCHIGIVYGYISLCDNKPQNMLVFTYEGRDIFDYAKIHPFSYGEESGHYVGGERIVSGMFEGISMGGFICYDLRFPEIFQISSKKNEVIFVIANWPKERINHWRILLQARAIENQCFMVGVNRIGSDGKCIYVPSSMAFDPYGTCVAENREGKALFFADIDTDMAEKYRREFPLRADRKEELYVKIHSLFTKV